MSYDKAIAEIRALYEPVRYTLEKGSVVKVNGIPLELTEDTIVLVHSDNIPLLYDGPPYAKPHYTSPV